MRLAVSIWKDRVSPVMDVAGRLMVVSIRDGREHYRFEADIMDLNITHTCRLLKHLRVDTLICGAISDGYLSVLRDSGLRIIPDMAGTVDAVIEAFIDGNLLQPRFFLPGRTGDTRGVDGAGSTVNPESARAGKKPEMEP